VATRVGTRADFVLVGEKGRRRILEVKTVVDTDYNAAWTLPTGLKCVFPSGEVPYRRTALFPWGMSKQKGPMGEEVVSARAIKHVREMTEAVAGGECDGTVLFVVGRGDAEAFRPNVGACPSFGKYLKKAQEGGVQLLVKRVRWGEGEERGGCFDDGWLEVDLP